MSRPCLSHLELLFPASLYSLQGLSVSLEAVCPHQSMCKDCLHVEEGYAWKMCKSSKADQSPSSCILCNTGLLGLSMLPK